MALQVQFGGDMSETREQVERVLRARYDPLLGVHDVVLHYSAGRGYGVMSATRTQATGRAYQPAR